MKMMANAPVMRLEGLMIVDKRKIENALKPFKNGFAEGVNGTSFSLNREQVKTIEEILNHVLKLGFPKEPA